MRYVWKLIFVDTWKTFQMYVKFKVARNKNSKKVAQSQQKREYDRDWI